MLLATGVLCVVAVGFASLIDSKPGAIIALIAWQVIASPLISQHHLAGQRPQLRARARRSRISARSASHGTAAAPKSLMSTATAVIVSLAAWLVVFLGARRLAHAHDGRLSVQAIEPAHRAAQPRS